MSPLRTAQIRSAIATLLDQTDGWLYQESRLFSDINAVAMVVPPITLQEFEAVMRKMEIARHVLRFRGDDAVKTKLTDEGKAELLS